MAGRFRVAMVSACLAALAVGPGVTTAAGAPAPRSVAAAAPVEAAPTGLHEAVRPIARCSAWRFVPPDRTTCLASTSASIRVRTSAGRYLAWSASAGRWVPIAYRWSTVARRLVLDARLLVVRAPAPGLTHTVWRYRCQDWTLSPQGATICRAGSAERVRARLDTAGGPARVQSGGRYVTTPYRWSTAGGFLALDARLLPPPVPATATVTLGATVSPAFDPGTTDYVTRCEAEGPVAVTATTTGAARVSLDGAPPAAGIDADVALAPGQSLHVDVTGTAVPVTYVVRCLPADFPALTADGVLPRELAGVALAALDFVETPPPYAVLTDRHGTPVWWFRDTTGTPADVKPWGTGVAWASNGTFTHRSLDGTVVWSVGPGLDMHDLVPLPDGHLLGMRYVTRDCAHVPSECVDLRPYGGPDAATVTDGEIVELTTSGEVLWTWSTRDHIALAEADRWIRSGQAVIDGPWDVVHLNSVEPDGDGIIFSARHLDAIVRIDRATGEIDWKLGGTTTPQSLTVDTGADTFGGQHDARRLPDGTISVSDNRTAATGASRAVRYSVDPVARTATLVETLQDAEAPGSFCCGSARKLAGGGWVAAWGGLPLIGGYSADGTRVFSLRLPGRQFSYRAAPLPASDFPLSALRAGMDAMHPRS